MENVRAEIVELCDIKTHLCMKAESLYINLSKHIYRGILNFVVFVIRNGDFFNNFIIRILLRGQKLFTATKTDTFVFKYCTVHIEDQRISDKYYYVVFFLPILCTDKKRK